MTEKLHPETREFAGWHYILPDDDHPIEGSLLMFFYQ